MKTILCYAFPVADTGTVWDLLDRLAAADVGYMHDCVSNTVYVQIEDAEKAVAALAGITSAQTGRMTLIPEAYWPSLDDTGLDENPTEIDYDPREEWCAGPAPRHAF